MRVHQLTALVLWCTEAKKALAFPKNSFSFSSSRTRRRRAVISASISRGSGRPCAAAWRRSRSSLTHRPTTDSPSPQSRATDAIVDPVSNTKDATSRRYSGVKRRRVPITGTSLSAGTHTRLTKCQQHKPNPRRWRRRIVCSAIWWCLCWWCRCVSFHRRSGSVVGSSTLRHHTTPRIAHHGCHTEDFPSGARYMLPEHILSGNLQVNP